MTAPRTLTQALAQAARTDHGFTFINGGATVVRSYAGLQDGARRVARLLLESGLRRGDLVAIVIADSEQFLMTLFGASMAGVVPASLYPPAATGSLDRYFEVTSATLQAARARAVVTSASLAGGFDTLRATCPDLDLVLACEALDAQAAELESQPSLDDIAFVQFTSGSTSAPKGVALTHRNLSANIDAINGPEGLATSSHDVGVSWLPLYHDMGLVGMTLGPVFSGRPAVLLTPQMFVKRPAEWLRAISRYRGTISFAPNFAYDLVLRRVKDADLTGLDLSSWRIAGCGAEPIHHETLAAFADRLSGTGFRATSFFPSYGLAEHVLAATLPARDRLLRVEHVRSDDLTARRVAVTVAGEGPTVALVSCGRALPGHTIRVVDEDGRALPDRSVGEIALSGPSVMLGYYGERDLTARTIQDGWLFTGDLGYFSDGELFVCGRVKDIIIMNGRKYHPQDVEWAVRDVPGIRRDRVVAFGAAGAGKAERVVLVFEPSSASSSHDAVCDAVRRRVGDVLGLYVDDVVPVPSGTIGRTTSGKVQRMAVKAQYQAGLLTGVYADMRVEG